MAGQGGSGTSTSDILHQQQLAQISIDKLSGVEAERDKALEALRRAEGGKTTEQVTTEQDIKAGMALGKELIPEGSLERIKDTTLATDAEKAATFGAPLDRVATDLDRAGVRDTAVGLGRIGESLGRVDEGLGRIGTTGVETGLGRVDADLSRVQQTRAAEEQDIINRRRDALGGLNAAQINAERSQAAEEIARQTETSRRRLAGIQASQGVRGGTAAAQQMAAVLSGDKTRANFERDLLLKQNEIKTQALGAFENTIRGAEAASFQRQGLNLQQEQQERQLALQNLEQQYRERGLSENNIQRQLQVDQVNLQQEQQERQLQSLNLEQERSEKELGKFNLSQQMNERQLQNINIDRQFQVQQFNASQQLQERNLAQFNASQQLKERQLQQAGFELRMGERELEKFNIQQSNAEQLAQTSLGLILPQSISAERIASVQAAATQAAGGGGGGGPSVLCTALYKQGLLSDDVYKADAIFGIELERTDPALVRGYRLWATPVAKLMEKSPKLSNLVAPSIGKWALAIYNKEPVMNTLNIIEKALYGFGIVLSRVCYKILGDKNNG